MVAPRPINRIPQELLAATLYRVVHTDGGGQRHMLLPCLLVCQRWTDMLRHPNFRRGVVFSRSAKECARVNRRAFYQSLWNAGLKECHFWWESAWHGQLDLLDWANALRPAKLGGDRICAIAARRGHLDVLLWARRMGCADPEYTLVWAIKGGHLSMVNRLIEVDGWRTFGGHCHYLLAKRGYLDVLRRINEDGRNHAAEMCIGAAKGGRLEVLEWLLDSGCDFHTDAWYCAAGRGHLKVLQWAARRGFAWDKLVGYSAVINRRMDVLRWVVEDGHPFN